MEQESLRVLQSLPSILLLISLRSGKPGHRWDQGRRRRITKVPPPLSPPSLTLRGGGTPPDPRCLASRSDLRPPPPPPPPSRKEDAAAEERKREGENSPKRRKGLNDEGRWEWAERGDTGVRLNGFFLGRIQFCTIKGCSLAALANSLPLLLLYGFTLHHWLIFSPSSFDRLRRRKGDVKRLLSASSQTEPPRDRSITFLPSSTDGQSPRGKKL